MHFTPKGNPSQVTFIVICIFLKVDLNLSLSLKIRLVKGFTVTKTPSFIIVERIRKQCLGAFLEMINPLYVWRFY